MTLGLINVAGESGMSDANQRAGSDFMRSTGVQAVYFVRLELPANDGGERPDEIGYARVHKQTRGIDLKVFAFEMETLPVSANTFVRPFAAHAKVRLGFYYPERCDLVWAWAGRGFDSPPLRPPFGIGDGFEDASWRSGDEDLRQDSVVVGSESCGCHFDSSYFDLSNIGTAPSTPLRTAPSTALRAG
jgi:hypothetical protein